MAGLVKVQPGENGPARLIEGRYVSTLDAEAMRARYGWAVAVEATLEQVETVRDYYVVVTDGAPGPLLPRPSPPDLPQMAAGVAVVVAGFAEGARVRLFDGETGAEAAATADAAAPVLIDATQTLTLTLPAGPWRVEIGEAFPMRARSYTIEVGP